MTVDRYRLVPAAYVVLRRDGEVLMTRRHNTGWRDGWWSLPAGHVEPGESCVETALRETAEEVGVRIEAGDLAPLCAVHRTARTGDPSDERVDFFFAADRFAGDPRILEPDRSDDIGWFGLGALPGPVVAPVDAVLAGLRSGRLPAVFACGF